MVPSGWHRVDVIGNAAPIRRAIIHTYSTVKVMKLARFEHSDNVYLGLVDAAASMISGVAAPPVIGDPMIAMIQAQLGGA